MSARVTLGLKLVLGAIVAWLVYYAYFGQIIDGMRFTTYQWLRAHWTNVSNYSHGPLIPWIALGLVWWKRAELRKLKFEPDNRAALWLLPALFIYFIGIKGGQERVVVISLVVMLYALALSLGGRRFFSVVFFPITFLFLMVPLNFLDEMVGFPLRMWVARLAVVLLNWMGIEAVRVGSGIYSSVFQFDVADPCSGIRSLMALTTVTAAYAYVTQPPQWRRWVLFLCAMPLAMLGNLARVTSIAVVAQVYGQEVASKTYHDYSGYLVFGVALGTMVLIGWLLNLPYRQIWHKWLKPPPAVAAEKFNG